MTGKKECRFTAAVVAAVFFSISFVQFFHTEHSIFQSRTCPACHFNQVTVGVFQTAPPLVFQCFFIANLARVETPLPALERRDGWASRSPPLS
jgi:hypothetical protein